MALVTRLRTIRSTRRGSTSATHGRSPARTTTTVPRRSARARVDSTTRCARSTRFTSSRSRTAAPASKRLISSRSASSISKRSSSFWSSSAARAVGGSNRSRASCSTSPAIRTVVSGVRSSCDTSETNRRCTRESSSSWRICFCRLAAIWLNDVPSRAMSSSPRTCIRSSSRPDASRSATRRASRTGVTTCRVTSQVSAADQDQQQRAAGDQGAAHQRTGCPAARSSGTGSRACRCRRRPAG